MFPLRQRGKIRSILRTILLILALASATYYLYGEQEITGSTVQESYEKVFVTRVIDGDTFETQDGRKVRLICINTPEKGEPYSAEATNYLSTLVLHKEVLLEKDKSEQDRYGRLLRYARSAEDHHFINQDLVERGLAETKRFKPDEKYCEEFEFAQTRAQAERVGIWS